MSYWNSCLVGIISNCSPMESTFMIHKWCWERFKTVWLMFGLSSKEVSPLHSPMELDKVHFDFYPQARWEDNCTVSFGVGIFDLWWKIKSGSLRGKSLSRRMLLLWRRTLFFCGSSKTIQIVSMETHMAAADVGLRPQEDIWVCFWKIPWLHSEVWFGHETCRMHTVFRVSLDVVGIFWSSFRIGVMVSDSLFLQLKCEKGFNYFWQCLMFFSKETSI